MSIHLLAQGLCWHPTVMDSQKPAWCWRVNGKGNLVRWLMTVAIAVTMVSSVAADAPSPNIILILTDDQGWSGTSVQMDPDIPNSRSDFYQTPNLDRLAASGMRFSNAYAASPVCSPTRASIQIGRSPARIQMTDVTDAGFLDRSRFKNLYNGHPLTPPIPATHFPYEDLTIAETLRQANPDYVTANLGKWHISGHDGTRDPRWPRFDLFGASFPEFAPPEDPKTTFSLSSRANAFLEAQVSAGKPFYMQLQYPAVHWGYAARMATIEKYENLPAGERHGNVTYAAMTEDLDSGVGMVLQKVQDLGIEDNTYIFYFSDNGPSFGVLGARESEPLFMGKGAIWEGGIRVPMVVKGPGIEAGSVSDVPVISMDLFSTIADLGGVTDPRADNVEGASIVPLLRNGGRLPAGTENLQRQYAEGGELYFHYPHYSGNTSLGSRTPASAVRDGDFKLVRVYSENAEPDKVYLFNLADSVTESSDLHAAANLADDLPEKTAELLAKLDNWLHAVDASQAYDVAANVQLRWDAGQPGTDPNGWRSTIDVEQRARETWAFNQGSQQPRRIDIHPHQPGLPMQAHRFDGDDGMTRKFFHVSDFKKPDQYDNNRSVSFEFWLRFDALGQEQMLFESGDGTSGLSLTFGGDDGNEVRFRALGNDGEEITTTSKIDQFSDPTRDFIQVVAVLSDSDADRYAEIYINGALVGRADGVNGTARHINWDGFDQAGLGRAAGSEVGANGGDGDLPFAAGNFKGELTSFRFYNDAIDGDTVRTNYNALLDDVDWGIAATSGAMQAPSERPSHVAEGVIEADNTILVVQERNDRLDNVLPLDILPVGGQTYGSGGLIDNIGGQLPSGTEFTSYLLHFDPVGDPGSLQNAFGAVTFKRPIQGILVEQSSLQETDVELGVIGLYTTGGRAVDVAGDDFLTLSDDLQTLTVWLNAIQDEIVQLRVLTELFPALTGDMDLDGDVDIDDIDDFVLGLNHPAAYESLFGVTPSVRGDADGDGDQDFDDIDEFVAFVVQRVSARAHEVPEPSGLVLAAISLLGAGGYWWRKRSLPT